MNRKEPDMKEKERYELEVVNIRLVKEPSIYSNEPVTKVSEAKKLVANEFAQYDREAVVVMNLKNNGQVININVVSIGTSNCSYVNPKDVFKSSILSDATNIIVAHNHPSGSIKPLSDDIEVTERLKKAGEIIGIKLIDHIIIGGVTGEMFSFAEEGML